jgi:mercuric reductase
VEHLRGAKYTDVLSELDDVELIKGRATLRGPNTIAVGAATYEADKVLIATGTRPRMPQIPGLRDPGVWDSTRALAAQDLPRDLVVLGGSYIALELGQMFARLGSRVTIVQRGEQILSGEDRDVAETLTGFLRDEGIAVRVGHQVERLERDGGDFRVTLRHAGGSDQLSGSAVIAALGRAPNTPGLSDVGLDKDGFIEVGEDLETSVPGVYAAGDVIGEPLYVYAAAYEGKLAAQNALSGASDPRDYTALPWVIFSDPQVSGVGLNERQAATAGVAVDVSVVPLKNVPRALAARDTRGFIKLLRARGEDRLVGARIVAPEGSEQIMEATLMIRFGLSVSEVARHFHPYLTQGEAIKLALLSFDKDVEKLSCCAS